MKEIFYIVVICLLIKGCTEGISIKKDGSEILINYGGSEDEKMGDENLEKKEKQVLNSKGNKKT